MRWRKRGLLVAGDHGAAWARSHAMVPIAVPSGGGSWRVWFSAKDLDGRSLIGYADVDPDRRVRLSTEAVLGLGPLGAFDDSGVMTSSMVEHEGRLRLYYIGWTRGVSVPFYTFVGCAESTDGGETFERLSPAPILERSPADPYLTTSPWVLFEDGVWRMWYASGTGWGEEGGRAKHRYHIRYAESDDGILWRRDGRVCIDYANESEYALARPCVVRDADCYRMWFSFRGNAYRIGYAESSDGINWARLDGAAGIDVSVNGWDSEMIEYPFVFDDENTRYMLYNGNGYGATGFGLAEFEEPA